MCVMSLKTLLLMEMNMRKPELYEALLCEYPCARAKLQAHGVYKLSK